MIKIEKLDTDNILGNPNMKYSIDFGGQKRYFTENALLELQIKLNTFALHNVVGQSEQLTCDNCKHNCLVWDDNHPCATCAGMDNYVAR